MSLGVRPGMTYDEAANVILCTNDLMVVQADSRGFQIKTFGQTLRQGFNARFAEAARREDLEADHAGDAGRARSVAAATASTRT